MLNYRAASLRHQELIRCHDMRIIFYIYPHCVAYCPIDCVR